MLIVEATASFLCKCIENIPTIENVPLILISDIITIYQRIFGVDYNNTANIKICSRKCNRTFEKIFFRKNILGKKLGILLMEISREIEPKNGPHWVKIENCRYDLFHKGSFIKWPKIFTLVPKIWNEAPKKIYFGQNFNYFGPINIKTVCLYIPNDQKINC